MSASHALPHMHLRHVPIDRHRDTDFFFHANRSSNSLRVIKTTKQTSAEAVTYPQVVRNIIAKDGLVNGLLIRGLGTKILANGLQGMMFTVLWRLGQDWWAKKEQA